MPRFARSFGLGLWLKWATTVKPASERPYVTFTGAHDCRLWFPAASLARTQNERRCGFDGALHR